MVASPELTGGAGFTFEDAAVAIYLAALLGEEDVLGLPDRVIVRVAVQQAAFGEPLDDLIVDGRARDEGFARLSLQVKRRLTVSAARSNNDFREIVQRAWETVNKKGFRDGVDRVGAITGTISDESKRTLETICEWARDSATSETFMARFAISGQAGQQHRSVLETLRKILSEATEPGPTGADVHQLLRHFVLLRLNLLHEGSVDEANVVARLRNHLSADDADRAGDLWRQLRVVAQEGAGRAAEFDRRTLLARLLGSYRFAGTPSLQRDLERLAEEARLSLLDIENDIDGYTVPRPSLIAEAEQQLQERLFLQITGLPGTGKSAVQRELAENHQRLGGTILVIKSDRITGSGWSFYAHALGLVAPRLEDLLTEMAAVGSPILFIDGLDRIEVQHRHVVLDLMNTILNSSALRVVWRIVATVRDSIEPLRTWLPADLARHGGISTLFVRPFEGDELTALVKARPALLPLLFGEDRVAEIARRPFFAAVLAKSFSGSEADPLMPRSETELVGAWWTHGGYLASPSKIARRQRTLLQLAKAGAISLGRRMGLDDLDLEIVDDLKRDGILRDARGGHSVQFAHDIFFEWAFLQVLIRREDEWIDEIYAVGEPPALGRSVELLSQEVFIAGDGWEQHLAQVESSSMRSQWTRAWLLGPLGAANFVDRADRFATVLLRDNARRLTKMVIWFQAEKTRPNPLLLSHRETTKGLSRREIEQAADSYGVPSDFLTWNRWCVWLINNIKRCPAGTIPDIVSVFEVWQNGWADTPNSTSDRILGLIKGWLEDIEDGLHPEKLRYDRVPWEALGRGSLEELEDRLRALLLRAARARPKIASAYLTRLRTRPRLRDHAFRKILPYASVVSETSASPLVDLALAKLKEDLPADVAARPKPRGIIPSSISHHDWRHLAIDDDLQNYFPPSPLREPFASLFEAVSAEALRLVRDLTNHAITAWRQLFELDWERRATPLPLMLDFPWEHQILWGDASVYRWFRGHGGPHAVEAGLMALEHWAFGQVEQGREVDEVIRDVVSGHESVAVLGIAVALALNARRVSRATLPLVTSQRLWHWDLNRSMDDHYSQANLMGFTSLPDRRHADAVRDGNAREARRLEIRFLAQLFVLCSDEDLRTAAQTAIQAFPEDLPFDFEEERGEERTASLRRTAEIWAEFGRQENYNAVRAEDGKGVYIQLINPRSIDPDIVAAAQQHETMTERLKILNWVHNCFEHRHLSDNLSLSEALEHTKRLDAAGLFTEPHRNAGPMDSPANVVSGVAAVALSFSKKLDETDLAWATDVTMRAAATPEEQGKFWFSGAALFAHPCLSAVHGLAALIRRGIALHDAKCALLRLAGHPLEQVSETAIGAAMSIWNQDAEFAWIALRLALKLSIGLTKGAEGSADASHPDHVRQAVEKAIDELDEPGGLPQPSLDSIPAAWVFAPPLPRGDPFPGEAHSADPVWRNPDVFLRWDFLPKVLELVPIEQVMSDASRRTAFLGLCDQLVAWTIERLNPPWQSDEEDRHDRRGSELLEWRASLYRFLAHVALHMDQDEVRRRFLEPVFALDHELATSLIRPFVDTLVCAVMDAPAIDPQAITLIDDCLERMLEHQGWSRARRNDGELRGFNLPDLVRTFLFVQVEHAGGAARFANGDWHEVERILPIVDPLVRAAGDLPSVASSFLTLCERSVDHYPPDHFVEQVTVLLAKQPGTPAGWRGSTVPGRIAALVQAFAQQSQPLPLGLAQGMLRILDRLIDMGDRRSAALQTSEIFRNVATTPTPARSD